MPSNRAPYRKLTRLGKNSFYVVVPRDVIRKLGWRERQKLTVKQRGKRVVIEDWTGK
jgi:bifunctional DNA-binding transcriptional regulator/antitoxin component of YhaV-PrlF toxin-antitoxin module